MSHNKPRANAFYTYCKHRRAGSVADAFAQFDDSIVLPPNLSEVNESGYRRFCALAQDSLYRQTVYGRYTGRYVRFPIRAQ